VIGGKTHLTSDANSMGFGHNAFELNALLGLIHLNPIETAKEVEMPPGATELTVGRKLETNLLLPLDCISSAAVICPCSRLARASFSAWVRNKLPTISAR
jgi:hypothetical protein